jgi:hypothetical protein
LVFAWLTVPVHAQPRHEFTIDPRTPVSELLPLAPESSAAPLPWTVDELAKVPEVVFENPSAIKPKQAEEHIARLVARINHLNKTETDQFIKVLGPHRPDLAGLPFLVGDSCRQGTDRGRAFFGAALVTRLAFADAIGAHRTGVQLSGACAAPNAAAFWSQYDDFLSQISQAPPEAIAKLKVRMTDVGPAFFAALMQILGPESLALRQGLVQRLAENREPHATRSLAQLAIFSFERELRQAATAALKDRDAQQYTGVMLAGLRYPWPAVATHASEAIVSLNRKDLVPQIVAVLDTPDPRAPAAAEFQGTKMNIVRELVRINHHRSCLLCHAPGNTLDARDLKLTGIDQALPVAVTAPVPSPDQPLPPPTRAYNLEPSRAAPDLLVRVDVTYLRQDFSLMQQVKNSGPWPERQRFDFLVRTRAVTSNDVDAYRHWRQQQGRSYLAPHHQAAIAALRGLTGLDVPEPTATAWRAALQP